MVFQRPNPFPKSHYDIRLGPPLIWHSPQERSERNVEKSLRQAALWEEVR